jgi:hypothetical protein
MVGPILSEEFVKRLYELSFGHNLKLLKIQSKRAKASVQQSQIVPNHLKTDNQRREFHAQVP